MKSGVSRSLPSSSFGPATVGMVPSTTAPARDPRWRRSEAPPRAAVCQAGLVVCRCDETDRARSGSAARRPRCPVRNAGPADFNGHATVMPRDAVGSTFTRHAVEQSGSANCRPGSAGQPAQAARRKGQAEGMQASCAGALPLRRRRTLLMKKGSPGAEPATTKS